MDHTHILQPSFYTHLIFIRIRRTMVIKFRHQGSLADAYNSVGFSIVWEEDIYLAFGMDSELAVRFPFILSSSSSLSPTFPSTELPAPQLTRTLLF
jgi:hypothetical protein